MREEVCHLGLDFKSLRPPGARGWHITDSEQTPAGLTVNERIPNDVLLHLEIGA